MTGPVKYTTVGASLTHYTVEVTTNTLTWKDTFYDFFSCRPHEPGIVLK
jgi:hypothetical protein